MVTERLSIIFRNYIDCGIFPDTWKKSHIISAQIKNYKRSLNNYPSVALWTICGKIFERIIIDAVFFFLEKNHSLNIYYSGYLLNDSYESQLFSLIHSIDSDFDHNLSLEVRGNFTYILKAFDKV